MVSYFNVQPPYEDIRSVHFNSFKETVQLFLVSGNRDTIAAIFTSNRQTWDEQGKNVNTIEAYYCHPTTAALLLSNKSTVVGKSDRFFLR